MDDNKFSPKNPVKCNQILNKTIMQLSMKIYFGQPALKKLATLSFLQF